MDCTVIGSSHIFRCDSPTPTITYDIKQMSDDINILKDTIVNLQKDMEDIKKLLKEHFDCAPDGPLYIEAKDRFENNRYL